MVVYMLVVAALGLFGCCCIFEEIVLVAVFGRKNDLDSAGYDWNADSGGVNFCFAVVEVAVDVVVDAAKSYSGNTMTKLKMDY